MSASSNHDDESSGERDAGTSNVPAIQDEAPAKTSRNEKSYYKDVYGDVIVKFLQSQH